MQIILCLSNIFRSNSAKMKSIDKKTKIWLFAVPLIILAGSTGLLVVKHSFLSGNQTPPTTKQIPSTTTFIASIDTMKESRDTETRSLSSSEILAIVKLSASVNTNYITVDTHWDYSNYLQQWVNAIRAAGRHVWFRSQPNQWENQNGATGTMTPAQYEAAEQNIILTHASLFQSGDILND